MFSASHRTSERRAIGFRPAAVLATTGAALLIVIGAVAPYRDASAAAGRYVLDDQDVQLAAAIEPAITERDGYTAEVSPERIKAALVAEHTNYSWAKLVLWYGGWPITDDSVTTIVRWMRQENGVDNWWNRNNPLNNGWGTIEGNFLSGYTTLVDAAEQCADALHSRSGYAGIVAALQDGSSADATAAAIWASDWATGHYDYGGHWSTAPVTVVQAPADAWG